MINARMGDLILMRNTTEYMISPYQGVHMVLLQARYVSESYYIIRCMIGNVLVDIPFYEDFEVIYVITAFQDCI